MTATSTLTSASTSRIGERPPWCSGSIVWVFWGYAFLCWWWFTAQELCESWGGRPGLPVPNSPYGLCGHKAAFEEEEEEDTNIRAQELCESWGGRPSLPVPNSPYGLCGRKATLNLNRTSGAVWKSRWLSWCCPSLIVLMVSVDVKQHWTWTGPQELCESRGGRPGLLIPNNPYGLCGHKATFKKEEDTYVITSGNSELEL